MVSSSEGAGCPFYVTALETLNASGVPFLTGGAYALERYTGIARDTKDLDLFVCPGDCEGVLHALERAGHRIERTFPHWLSKAFCGDDVIDVIFSSGNGVAIVDDVWFAHAEDGDVLGVPVKLSPPEEMIWSKAFIMERERHDGADVAHLLRARGPTLDWHRLVDRFDRHWRVLLAHLVLFGFVYPSERGSIPRWVVEELADRLRHEAATAAIGE